MNLAPLIARLRTVFSIDPRSLALFRAALAVLVLLDLALRSGDLSAFYTDAGVLPRADLLEIGHRWHWSLHAASGELWWQASLFAIAAVAALALLVGYRTRLASIATFALLASLLNRNPLLLQGGDQLLVVLAFWAMFLPLGAHRSVDAALRPALRDAPDAVLARAQASATRDDATRLDDVARPILSVATVAVILQVLYLYTFTALLKTGDAWTTTFDAAFHALSLQHFTTPIGAWFATLPTPLLRAATLFVLAVEYVGPALVLLPLFWPWLRLAGLALLASLHVAFGLMLHIGLFPLIDLASLTLLLPAAAWTWLATRHGARRDGRARIVIHYDEGCGFCLKTCLILRELLLLPRTLAIRPAQHDPLIGPLLERENSWVVTDAAGTPHLHWHAMALLFRASPIARPLGHLMTLRPLMALGNRVYALVQRRRQRLGELTAHTLPWREVPAAPTLAGSAFALLALYVVTAYNVYGLPALHGTTPAHVDRLARITRLDQRWSMFAPYPLTTSSYPLVPGVLRDGRTVDLHTLTSSDADWQAPDAFYRLYDGYRWRKYLGRVDTHADNAVRRAFGHWLCRSWNHDDRPREEQLATLEVHFVKLRTNTTGAPKAETRRTAWRHWCYGEFAPEPTIS